VPVGIAVAIVGFPAACDSTGRPCWPQVQEPRSPAQGGRPRPFGRLSPV